MTRAARRWVALDLLRLAASVQMIQGHTLDALLADQYRSGAIFNAWSWLRGLTAPAFLCAAGLAYGLVARHQGEAQRVQRRIRRALTLIALGYAMRLPWVWQGGGDPWVVDILQCVGVTLLLMEGLARLLPAQALAPTAWCLSALFLALAEFDAPAAIPAPLRHYLSADQGALFPLLPWAAFAFAGLGLGCMAAPPLAEASAPALALPGGGPPLRRLGGVAGALLCLAALAGWQGFGVSPLQLQRLGLVVCALWLLAALSRSWAALPRRLEQLCGQTLSLYLFHVVVLYAGGFGLRTIVGHVLSPAAAVGAALLMLLLSVVAASLWARRPRLQDLGATLRGLHLARRTGSR